MKTAIIMTALAIALGLGTPAAFAQAQGELGGHAKGLAIAVAETAVSRTPAKLTVTSPSFKNGGDIPFENTQYRGNHFPGLSWGESPTGTKSYAVAVQGALGAGDDLSGGTSVHFVMYNIPAGVTKLDAGATKPPAGAAMGNTVHDMADFYAGPHTHNFTKHAYHYQVLALDTVLPIDPQMTLVNLEKLMDGHILATGEVMGLVAMDPDSDEGKAFIAKQAAAKPAAPLAQNGAPPNPTGFGGAIISTAADNVVLKTKDGKDVKIVMTPGWTVATARDSSPNAIKPGDFIASIQTNLDANTGKANEVRVFEPGYQPEIGSHPMPQAGVSITHGTVKTSTKTAAGQELEVVYPGGSRHIIVSPDIKVTAYDLHDRSLAKPGAMVSGVTRKDANGVDVGGRLVVAP